MFSDIKLLLLKVNNKMKFLGDYYKCKRHNSSSGNDAKDFQYYDIVNELLNDRPASKLNGAFETTSEASGSQLTPVINCEVTFLDYGDIPDKDRAVPGISGTQSIKSTNGSTSSISTLHTQTNTKMKKRNSVSTTLDEMKCLLQESFRRDIEEDNVMSQLLDH